MVTISHVRWDQIQWFTARLMRLVTWDIFHLFNPIFAFKLIQFDSILTVLQLKYVDCCIGCKWETVFHCLNNNLNQMVVAKEDSLWFSQGVRFIACKRLLKHYILYMNDAHNCVAIGTVSWANPLWILYQYLSKSHSEFVQLTEPITTL